jgi:hypothetical protein
VLRGVAWPSSSGNAGQILSLASSTTAEWASNTGGGSSGYTRTTTTDATYTMNSDAEVLFVNRASGATITLPSISSAGDKYYVIIDKSGSISTSNPIVVQAASGDSIMGQSSFSIQGAYNSIKLAHDNVDYWALV